MKQRLGVLASSAWAAVLACGAMAGCGGSSTDFNVQRVTPAIVPYGTSEWIVIQGAFYPATSVDLGAAWRPTLFEHFQVEIDGKPCPEVYRQNTGQLEARTPIDLDPGRRYDLVVTDPRGQKKTLPEAVEVTIRDPARIAFVTSVRTPAPGVWSQPITIELRDLEGFPSRTTVPMTLHVTSDSPSGVMSLDVGAPVSVLEQPLPAGTKESKFQYLDPTPGYHTLTAVAAPFPSVTQTVAVGALGKAAAVTFVGSPGASAVVGAPTSVSVEIQDETGGPARFPPDGFKVDVVTDDPAIRLSQWPEGPFGPIVTKVLQGGDGRLTLFVLGTEIAQQVELRATARDLSTGEILAPDALGLPVALGPVAGATRPSAETSTP